MMEFDDLDRVVQSTQSQQNDGASSFTRYEAGKLRVEAVRNVSNSWTHYRYDSAGRREIAVMNTHENLADDTDLFIPARAVKTIY